MPDRRTSGQVSASLMEDVGHAIVRTKTCQAREREKQALIGGHCGLDGRSVCVNSHTYQEG